MFDKKEIKGCTVSCFGDNTFEIRRKNGYSVVVDYDKENEISIDGFINDRVDAYNELMDFLDNQNETYAEIQDKAIEFWKNLRRVDCWAKGVVLAVDNTFVNSKIQSIHRILWDSYEAYMNLFLEKYPQVNHFKTFLMDVLKNEVERKCKNHVQMP